MIGFQYEYGSCEESHGGKYRNFGAILKVRMEDRQPRSPMAMYWCVPSTWYKTWVLLLAYIRNLLQSLIFSFLLLPSRHSLNIIVDLTPQQSTKFLQDFEIQINRLATEHNATMPQIGRRPWFKSNWTAQFLDNFVSLFLLALLAKGCDFGKSSPWGHNGGWILIGMVVVQLGEELS